MVSNFGTLIVNRAPEVVSSCRVIIKALSQWWLPVSFSRSVFSNLLPHFTLKEKKANYV